jgi:zinc protease
MKIPWMVWVALFVMLLWGVPRQALAFFPVLDQTLDNGLRVIALRVDKAPVVQVYLWYRVGAADEPDGKSGIAHMLEHMMFQGTETIPSGEYSNIIARHGGEDNATTSHDYTNYHVKIAADQLEQVLRLEADRMRHLKILPENFKSENHVVQEERRQRTDSDPSGRFWEQYRQHLYGAHPYGRPVIGWMADIKKFTLADLTQWYQRHYAPNNAILVVVGDVSLDETLMLAKRHFGAFPAIPDLTRPPFAHQDQIVAAQTWVLRDKNAKLSKWYAGFSVPSYSDEPDQARESYALDMLSEILGGGRTSRLYQRLVIQEQRAIGADADYGGLSRDTERFLLNATPKQARDWEDIQRIAFEEVRRLQTEPVSARELDKARNTLIADHIYSLDSVSDLAWIVGRLSVVDDDWRLVVHYPDRLREVTPADVQRVAQRYLNTERAIVGVLLPDTADASSDTDTSHDASASGPDASPASHGKPVS